MNEEPLQSEVLPEGRWLPLNSRRVTTAYLQLVAQSLGLPTGMSAEELRQQVEGRLLTMEHEPRNVQVIVQERSRVELRLLLVDKAGVFVESEPVIRDGDRQQESAVKECEELQEQMRQQSEEQAAQVEDSYRQLESVSKTLRMEEELGRTAGTAAGHRETEQQQRRSRDWRANGRRQAIVINLFMCKQNSAPRRAR